MNAKLYIILFLAIQTGYALEAIPKVDFNEEFVENTDSKEVSSDDVEIIFKNGDNGAQKSDVSIIKKRSELQDEDASSEIVCDGKKCTITVGNNDSSTKRKKVSADVHVKILTDTDKTDSSSSEEDEVPVVKGYAAVDPNSIKNMTEKTKNNPAPEKFTYDQVQIPSITLEPPRYEPKNWHEYLEWRSKMETTTTKRPQVKHDNFHPYSIGDINRKDGRENRIPGGWATPWKPVPGPLYPDDYFHYNVNRHEDGFYNLNPHSVTYCRCNRKPTVYAPKPHYNPYPRSWIIAETTTRLPLNGKLSPPFNSNGKNKAF